MKQPLERKEEVGRKRQSCNAVSECLLFQEGNQTEVFKPESSKQSSLFQDLRSEVGSKVFAPSPKHYLNLDRAQDYLDHQLQGRMLYITQEQFLTRVALTITKHTHCNLLGTMLALNIFLYQCAIMILAHVSSL